LIELIVAIGIFALMLTVIAVIVATVFTTVSTTVRQGQASASNRVNLSFVSDLLRGAVSPANAAGASHKPVTTSGCWGSTSPSPPGGLPLSATQARALSVVSAHDFDVVLCAYEPNAASGTPAVYEVGVEPETCTRAAKNGLGTACTLAVINWGKDCNPGTLSGCTLRTPTVKLSTTSTCKPGYLATCTTPAGKWPARVVFRLKGLACDSYCQGVIGSVTNGTGKVARSCANALGVGCPTTATKQMFGYFSPDVAAGQYKAAGNGSTNTPLNDAKLEKTEGVTLDLSSQKQVTTTAKTRPAQTAALSDLSNIQEIVVNATEVGASESALSSQVTLVNQAASGYVQNPLAAAMLVPGPDAFYQMSTTTPPSTTTQDIVRDSSGHGHTARAVNPVAWNVSGTGGTGGTGGRIAANEQGPSVTASYDKGLELTSTKPSHVTTSLTAWSTGTSSLTVAAWFQISSTPTDNPRIVAEDHTDATHFGFELEVTAGAKRGFFTVGNGATNGSATWTRSAPLTTKTWYFYVGTYTGTTVNAYINGELVATAPWSGGVWKAATTGCAGTTNVAVGWDPCYQGDALSGYAADVGLYTTAMSATQVQGIYQSTGDPTSHAGCLVAPMLSALSTVPRTSATAGAVTGRTKPSPTATKAALYPLDSSGTSTTVPDVAPYHHTAKATRDTRLSHTASGPTKCNTGQGGSMNFLGTTHVTLPSTTFGPTPPFAPAQLSVEAWVKFSSLTTSNSRIVANDHTDATTTSRGFELEVNNGGKSGFFIVGNGQNDGCAQWSYTANAAFPAGLQTGTWYFYVGAYNGSTVQVYLDGQLMSTRAVGETPQCGKTTVFTGGPVAASTKPVAIGYNPRYAGDYMHGAMADVAVLPVGLTGSEIVEQYARATAP